MYREPTEQELQADRDLQRRLENTRDRYMSLGITHAEWPGANAAYEALHDEYYRTNHWIRAWYKSS